MDNMKKNVIRMIFLTNDSHYYEGIQQKLQVFL